MCATTTILLNRLKESNYRRRITHTHTDAHARTQSHCTRVTLARAHTVRRRRFLRTGEKKKKTRTHTHTQTVRRVDCAPAGPHCQRPQISQLYRPVGGAVATGNRRRRAPHQTLRRRRRPQHTPTRRTFFTVFTYASPFSPCLRRTRCPAAARPAPPTGSRFPAALRSLSLRLARSRSVSAPPSLFARRQQVKTCTD